MRDVFWLARGKRLPLQQGLVELITPIAVPRGTNPPGFVGGSGPALSRLVLGCCCKLSVQLCDWVSSLCPSTERVKASVVTPRSDLNAVTFEEVDKVFYLRKRK